MSKNILLLYTIGMILITSCKKFVEIPSPSTSLTSQSVFEDNTIANRAMVSVFAQFANGGSDFTSYSLSTYLGLSADEFTNYSNSQDFIQLYTNGLISNNLYTSNIWQKAYNDIYQTNAILEGVKNSSKLDLKVRSQLKGEAKFMRAFTYFYLVNLFGNVPLVLTSDYTTTNQYARTDVSVIYGQIIDDLKDAEKVLTTNFVGADGVTSTTERVRPTQWAASALLARVYLYQNDWINAEAEATKVINNSAVFTILTDLNSVFKMNSKETIWSTPASSSLNTFSGRSYILSSKPSTVCLNKNLLNNFESGDKRKINWINSFTDASGTYYYPYKYKANSGNVSEYDVVLRLAEQYLIRAEARAQLGESNAPDDLNAIRNRAGLPNYAGATDKYSLLTAILHERQVELFTEFGHRWLDLKRTKNIDNVMNAVTPLKGGNPWLTTQGLYPIPPADLMADQNLTQNPGY